MVIEVNERINVCEIIDYLVWMIIVIVMMLMKSYISFFNSLWKSNSIQLRKKQYIYSFLHF